MKRLNTAAEVKATPFRAALHRLRLAFEAHKEMRGTDDGPAAQQVLAMTMRDFSRERDKKDDGELP